MNSRTFLTMVVAGLSAGAFAASYYIKDGVSDWTSGESYEGGTAPSAEGELIYLRAGRTVHLDFKDESSWSYLNDKKLVVYTVAPDSIVAVDVPETKTLTLTCEIGSYRGGNAGYSPTNGCIRKTGAGKLVLDGAAEAYHYPTGMEVREGELEVKINAKLKPAYGVVSVSNNATFRLPAGCGYCTLCGLWGDGLVTCSSEVETRVNAPSSKVPPLHSRFDGVLDTNVRIFGQGGCDFMGTESVTVKNFTAYGANENVEGSYALGVYKIGNKADAKSSIGKSQALYAADGGGGFRYLGPGETTDKKFSMMPQTKAYSLLSGGPNGGLVWNGDFSYSSASASMGRFCLAGDHETPCVVGGMLNLCWDKSGVHYGFHLLKVGNGTWRFADTANNFANRRKWDGGIAVREGTLEFDSLDNRGTACSLGMATNLNDGAYSGDYDPSHDVDYAFALGGTDTEGTLAFHETGTVTNGAYATDRTAVLNGDGRFRNDATNPFRFRGVRSLSAAAKTLTLDGVSTAENTLADITDDGAGAISLVKEGAGTWTLTGTNSFRGSLAVKGGKLKVANIATNRFTWFRWTVKHATTSTTAPLDNSSAAVSCQEFALYDAAGKRLNHGLSVCSNYAALAVGEAAYQRRGLVFEHLSLPTSGELRTAGHHLGRLFDDRLNYPEVPWQSDSNYRTGWCPVWRNPETVQNQNVSLADPSSWIPVVMRLDPTMGEVDAYDICHGGGYHPYSYTIEGSPDGLHWTEVENTNGFYYVASSLCWEFNKNVQGRDDGTIRTNTKGKKIKGHDANAVWPMLNNVSTVSVAAGATLEVEGPAIAVSHVTLNAAGAGTFKNLAFPENGTIDVTGLDPSAKKTTIVPTYEACDTANMAGWSLTIDGQVPKKHSYTITEDGKVTIWKKGLAIIVR